ncbi:MAG: hypothetical protein BAJALOKI2v1_240059 [Promethearchaeota archaeon]|nr:MAG: hypothetical protein BAJALOKI2v1_240059 [Candidatus Lokiarchaeota archaeon]
MFIWRNSQIGICLFHLIFLMEIKFLVRIEYQKLFKYLHFAKISDRFR